MWRTMYLLLSRITCILLCTEKPLRNFSKAIDYYLRALAVFNSPGPKVFAAMRSLEEAKMQLEKQNK